jgi:hypothetical protein
MTITATLIQSNVALNVAYGQHLDDAGTPALKAITIGFLPRKVVWKNLTDRTQYEWTTGNANGTTLKTVAAGTVTLDTADVAISVASAKTGTAPVQEKGTYIVTIAAAVILQNKANSFEIYE